MRGYSGFMDQDSEGPFQGPTSAPQAAAGGGHPVLCCVAQVDSALKGVADVAPVFMSRAEKAEALVALSATAARLEGLRLRVLACADDVAEEVGSRDVASWLAAQTREDRGGCGPRSAWPVTWSGGGPGWVRGWGRGW